MLRACKYCGRIHDSKRRCGSRPASKKKITDKDRIRSSYEWQKKREDIKQRDRYVCQLCIRGLYGTRKRYEHENLSVHHIIPLEENPESAMDDDNLITLCELHHELAEQGKIERKLLLAIVKQH